MPNINVKSMSKEEWLQARRKGIGGSDAAAVLAFSKYTTPIQLWREKTGRETPPDVTSLPAEVGNLIEPVIATLFSRRTGYSVKQDNKIRIHPTYDFMLGDLDRVVPKQKDLKFWVPLELKSTSSYNVKVWDQEDIPLPYYAQIQHYLFVTEREFGFVALLAGNNEFRWLKVQLDEEYWDLALPKYQDFWRCVENDVQPDPATAEEVHLVYPRSISESLELDTSVYHKVVEAKRYWYAKKFAEDTYKELVGDLKLMLKDHEAATFQGEVVCTFRSNQDKLVLDVERLKAEKPRIYETYKTIFDQKTFAKENPDLFEVYSEPQPGNRPFTIKPNVLDEDDITVIVE